MEDFIIYYSLLLWTNNNPKMTYSLSKILRK